MREVGSVAPINLSWYGWYGGSNGLDMEAFADRFEKPMKKGTISEVDVYFASVAHNTAEADIFVAINTPDEDGMPGTEIARATVKVKDLKYSDETYLATIFKCETPVEVETAFIVSVGGFPFNYDSTGSDEIAMFC